MSPRREKRKGKPPGTAGRPPRTGATTATVVKVAVTPANRPARFAGLVSRTSNEFMGSQNSGRETPEAKPPTNTTQFAGRDAKAKGPAGQVAMAIVKLVLAGIGRPLAMTKTPSGA